MKNKNTKAKTKTVKVKGIHSGRPKGSFSFVNVSFTDLSNKITDPSTMVPLPRKYASLLGLGNLKPISTSQALKPLQAAMEVSAATVTDLDKTVAA